MLRKHWVLGLLAAQVVVFLLLISLFMREPAANAAPASAPDAAPVAAPGEAPQAQTAVTGQYVWSYAAKFVCGYQPPSNAAGTPISGEPVLKSANYASEINIHNPNYKQVPLRKKFLVLVNQGQQPPRIVREPQQTEPQKIVAMTLGPDFAMMDDCNNLWTLAYPGVALPSPMPVFIGYLVVLSPVELDIDVVYTANTPGDLTAVPTSVSIDVERVTGKRVFVPVGAVVPN